MGYNKRVNPAKTISNGTASNLPPSRAASGLRLALLSGLLLFLANPPVGLWPLAWLALAPLIVGVTRAHSARQAAWRGYLFGWLFLGPTWYWVGLTIIAWTHSPIGWAAWAGLTFILAGFYGLWGGAAWWLARRTTEGWRILALAGAWAVMEWLRTLGSLTMPWAQVSYTQWRFLPILQMLDVTGAYGLSFLILLVNGGIAHWWTHRKQAQATHYVWASLTLTGLLFLFGLARLSEPEEGNPLPVAAMQDNFDPFHPPSDLRDYLPTFEELTSRAAASLPRPALYVWAESAAPGDALHEAASRVLMQRLAAQAQAPVLIGSRVVAPETGQEANSSVLFLPDGSPPTFYDKQQLVPFGEFIPYRSLWPENLTQSFGFFKTDTRIGSGPTLLRLVTPAKTSVALGPFICYESMYPRYARAMTGEGANLLVTQSNDSWFQSIAAQQQHLAAVVCRAVENRRAVVRSTTNGITGLIDSHGRITAQAPRNAAGFVTGNVMLKEGKTLYTRFGDWFIGLCGLVLVLAASGRLSPERTQRETPRRPGKAKEANR